MNIIEIRNLLIEKYGDNEYLEKYLEIVSSDDDVSYTEAHHILPRSIFPEFEDFKANEWNKVHLSAYNHFMAHYYFSKATDNCWLAVRMMANTRKVTGFKNFTAEELHEIAYLYESCKSNIKFSEEHKAKISASRKGKKLSAEHVAKMRASLTGKIHTNETKLKMRNAKKGKPKSTAHKAAIRAVQNSPETKEKMRAALKGRQFSEAHKAALRKSAHWKYYDELFKLWLDNNQPKRGNFRKLAVANNYPDARYDGMVKQFNRDIESNPAVHPVKSNVVQLKLPTPKVNQNIIEFIAA